jgi:hypothetical protein
MSRTLSNQLLAEFYGQESGNPFLTLFTITDPAFPLIPIRLVNNTVDVVSRGNTFTAFPISIVLPSDDGETAREVTLEIDNTSLELIEELRSVTGILELKVEMILITQPDSVQISLEELKLRNITYNKSKISAKLYMDDFLSSEMASERYVPTIFKGLF